MNDITWENKYLDADDILFIAPLGEYIMADKVVETIGTQKWTTIHYSENKQTGYFDMVRTMRVPGGMIIESITNNKGAETTSLVFVPCGIVQYEAFVSGVKFD